MTVDRLTLAGDRIQIDWDSGSCAAPGYNLIYGNLGNVSSYALTGASCDIGVAGSFFWDEVAGGDTYWLIVGVDATGSYESSWGSDSSGVERNGTTPSGHCNVPSKIDSGTPVHSLQETSPCKLAGDPCGGSGASLAPLFPEHSRNWIRDTIG